MAGDSSERRIGMKGVEARGELFVGAATVVDDDGEFPRFGGASRCRVTD